MTDIFISYSSQDAADVAHIAAGLEAEGYSVWRDRKLQAHRSYSDEIEERLASARAVLVLWSYSAVRSQWVRSEADRARLGSKLIQAAIDDAALPMPFDQIQCVSIGRWQGDASHHGWQSICQSVAALKGGEGPSHPPAPASQNQPASSASTLGVSVRNPVWLAVAGLSALPVIGWLAGIGPPGGGIQTAILVPMIAAIFLLTRHLLSAAGHGKVVALAICLTLATFGFAVAYNLAAQRFVATSIDRRVVLGCGWRGDAVALVRKQAPIIDADSQCPGDWSMAAPLFGEQAGRLYTRDGLDLIWLAISMIWGALFMALPAASAAMLRLFGR